MSALALPVAASASHPEVSLPGSNFEIDTDANFKVNDAVPSLDWANVNDLSQADSPSGGSDESFGNGTKEDSAVPSVVDGSIPPNKSDLKYFGVYQEGVGIGFLNMFWSRVQDPSGTTNMDFEFNRRQCTRNLTPKDPDCSANGMTPIRSVDDLLVTYDLSNGGVNATLSLRKWTVGGTWGTATPLNAGTQAAGSINTSSILVGDSDGKGAQSPRTFGEAQLNLASIFSSGNCQSFGSVYLKSRSSDAFSAAVKDFVPPKAVNVSNCASVDITKSTNDGSSPAGAVFTLYNGTGTGGTAAGTCTTQTDGTCIGGSGATPSFANLPVGAYTVDETTVPSGYNKDGTLPESFVLIAGQAKTLTYTNTRQPGSIRITKTDDAGAALDGAGFTIYSPAGVSSGAPTGSAAGSCTTGTVPGSGQCEITGLTPGSYTIDETTVPAGYAKDSSFPQAVTVNPGARTDVAASDPRKFKMIVIVCKEATNTLYSSAVNINGGAAESDSLSTAGLPGSISESALCGLTAGAKSGLLRSGNDHAASVTIP